jgi:hypothetical protein
LLVLPALTILWWPQGGDQALFSLGGRVLADGGIYWRDVWDVKQPGIFWLYALGERLGLGVLGARLFELLAILLAGLVVSQLVGGWGLGRTARLLAPLLVLGPYVLAGDANGVGQVEGLVTLPILVQYLAAHRALAATGRRPAAAWAAVAGVAAAAVAILKLLYLPLALIVWGVARADRRAERAAEQGAGRGVDREAEPAEQGAGSTERRHLAWIWAAWFAGIAVPALAVGIYVVAHGLTRLALYSTFLAPGEQLVTGLYSIQAWSVTLRALVLSTTLTGPLALVALLVALRRGRAAREIGLVAWFLSAAAIASPQLPTTYRVLLLLPPIGLLAVLGLDRVLRWTAARRGPARALIAALLVVAAVPLLPGTVRLVVALASAGPARWSLADGDRLAIGDRISGSPIVGPALRMRRTVRPGTAIHVFGDPLVYRLLGARPAIEMNGWGPEIMSERMWAETVRELDRSRPEWVFVQVTYQPDVDRVPALVTLLHRDYAPVAVEGAGGTWWRTSAPGSPAPSPEGNQLAAHP